MAAHVITSTELEALGARSHSSIPSAGSRLRAWFHGRGTRFRQRRLYRQTVWTLGELDDRILADIGVARHEIDKVAWTMSPEAL